MKENGRNRIFASRLFDRITGKKIHKTKWIGYYFTMYRNYEITRDELNVMTKFLMQSLTFIKLFCIDCTWMFL